MGSGSGEYSGYTDILRSNGKYEITSLDQGNVNFHAVYSWTYHNSEGLDQAGSEDLNAAFSCKTRRYVTRTDLDEYDKYDPSSLSVWLWIPPAVKAGDTISILMNFHVPDQSVPDCRICRIWNLLPLKNRNYESIYLHYRNYQQERITSYR